MSNFAARISSVAATKPDLVAIEQLHADGSVDATSYGALEGLSGRVAGWLAETGIKNGDRVAILADNNAAWIGTYLGILRIGAVAVPLDTAYKPSQVRTVLENSGARLLFTTPRYVGTALEGAACTSSKPGVVMMTGAAPGAPDGVQGSPPITPGGVQGSPPITPGGVQGSPPITPGGVQGSPPITPGGVQGSPPITPGGVQGSPPITPGGVQGSPPITPGGVQGSPPITVDASVFDLPRAIPPMASVTAADAAIVLYTSGTTADPKGVVLTHGNLDAEREGAFAVVKVTEEDAILGVLPLFHALAQMANLLLPLAVGARVVFLDTVSSSSLVAALSARGITIFACVPQFFYLIHQRITGEVRKRGTIARLVLRGVMSLNVQLRDRMGLNPAKRIFARAHRMLGERMRLFVTGGSKFDPAIARDLYGLGFTILNAYGLTETSGGATLVRPGDRLTESVGQPFPGVELRILERDAKSRDADGDASDNADDGEVLIRGPIVMREYFHRPDATAESLKDGWLHTGDLGRLDADGRLYITGRQKEIIVLSSGKNLYPEEIEAHYRHSAFIKELCVLGVSRPGEPSSERLHAIVVPDDAVMREKGIVNLRELLRFEIESLSVQLPAHKRILSYDVSLEPLPRTTTGKIRRHEIQRRLRERATEAADTERQETSDEAAWRSKPGHAAALTLIARKLERPAVLPDANLELDLGLDSMERVELLTLLEQRAGTRVPAETRATIFTIRQLVEAVAAAPAARGAVAVGATAEDPGSELPWDSIFAAPMDGALAADLSRKRWFAVIVSYLFLRVVALLLKITPGLKISGRENLPREGAFLISPNHQAYLDPFFLAAALPFHAVRRMFFVGASEYFETALLKRLAHSVNLIPVDPDANLINAMQAGAGGLRMGKALILFPEGERSIDGKVKKFRKGASILSAHLDVPIVPVAMDGLFELWPRGRGFNWRGLLPWRAKPVRIEFGPPLQVSRGAYTAGTATLRAAVVTMFDGMRQRG